MKAIEMPIQVQIACAICNQHFIANDINLQTRRHACGIEDTYYTCPHCGFEYLIAQTDEEIRILMVRRDALAGWANKPNSTENAAAYLALDAEIKGKMKNINDK